MPEIKLTQQHRQFIVQQRARFVMSNTVIAERLEDKEFADEHGFIPVKIHNSRISQILNQETDPKEIQTIRQTWLADFDDTPLAHKKSRVQELSKLYGEADTDDYSTYGKGGMITNTGDQARKIVKTNIMRQIKDEIGEDIDKLAEALKTPLHVIVDLRIQNIEKGLLAFNYSLPSQN